MSKIPVYLMPGMGAGPKIFKNLKWPDNYEVHYLKWLVPASSNESLADYTKRLLRQVKHDTPILLGVSFGGIIVQEMAKYIPVKQLIIVSSIKHHDELSPLFKTAFDYKLYKLVPSSLLKKVDTIEKWTPIKRMKRKMQFYQAFLEMDDPRYINWAIPQVIGWKQTQTLSNFVHIVGDKDPVFPVKYIQDPKIVVPRGRHDMIILKAKWFNEHLPNLLET